MRTWTRIWSVWAYGCKMWATCERVKSARKWLSSPTALLSAVPDVAILERCRERRQDLAWVELAALQWLVPLDFWGKWGWMLPPEDVCGLDMPQSEFFFFFFLYFIINCFFFAALQVNSQRQEGFHLRMRKKLNHTSSQISTEELQISFQRPGQFMENGLARGLCAGDVLSGF